MQYRPREREREKENGIGNSISRPPQSALLPLKTRTPRNYTVVGEMHIEPASRSIREKVARIMHTRQEDGRGAERERKGGRRGGGGGGVCDRETGCCAAACARAGRVLFPDFSEARRDAAAAPGIPGDSERPRAAHLMSRATYNMYVYICQRRLSRASCSCWRERYRELALDSVRPVRVYFSGGPSFSLRGFVRPPCDGNENLALIGEEVRDEGAPWLMNLREILVCVEESVSLRDGWYIIEFSVSGFMFFFVARVVFTRVCMSAELEIRILWTK